MSTRIALDSVRRIAARNGLRLEFADDVLAEARAWVDAPGIDDAALRDLTALPFITIDYERSNDLDQALYIERVGDGHRVYYALADASYYVRPGSALFDEAVRRAASYYLPGFTVPMLPDSLSEGIISLNPEVDRRALVVATTVDADGAASDTELFRARIHSRQKLTYNGVQAYIDDPTSSPLAGHDFCEALELLRVVGQRRIIRADEHDVVKFDRVSARLHLPSPDATELQIIAERRNGVQLWNEQISLLCNIEGARFLREHVDPTTGFSGVFRVHPPPRPEAMQHLRESICRLVDTLELDDFWRWPKDESLADYVDRLPDEGEQHRLARALQRQAMLINLPSYFATEPAPGHYGIGAAAYSRFSSPMREMVGVVTASMAFHQLAGRPMSDSGLDAERIETIVAGGNRAKTVQKKITRDANKLALDQLFRRDTKTALADRPVRIGTVMGLSATKLYVQLDDPPVEVKLYTEELRALWRGKTKAPNGFELFGPNDRCIRVGDPLRVRVARHDDKRQRWVLDPVD